MSAPRFVVGIDLGTTNTAVAAADCDLGVQSIEAVALAQLVREGEVAGRATLPSSIYISSGRDLPPGSLSLPWDQQRDYAVGEFACIQGARVPGRMVASAKSWLCHGGVDRTARILPWGGAEDCQKISPVAASSLVLSHVREAWDNLHPDSPLAKQEVVLTVPASFDEIARRLTVQAAEKAGLEEFTLIEEPQAAFYAWLSANGDQWEKILARAKLALVVDVGGGTTDFALVAVRHTAQGLGLERIAVGEHLLLGGDNMDIALARRVEERIAGGIGRLDSARWQLLVAQCRTAKERMLSENAPEEVRIELPGRGRGVVGGFLSDRLKRVEVRELIHEGFFPGVPADAMPGASGETAEREWGLPFAADLGVTRHLAAFLKRHCGSDAGRAEPARPDAILFNGGAMIPTEIRHWLLETISQWFGGEELATLASVDLNLAVARGAAYYGLARRGLGIRISGGSGRSYYLGLERPVTENQLTLLCLVARGMEEGEERQIDDPEFEILANQPVSFPLYTSTTRGKEDTGEVVVADHGSVSPLPPLRTVLRFGRKLDARTVPVTLSVKLSEVGTVEVWCGSRVTDHRWRLEFQTRGAVGGGCEEQPEKAAAELVVTPQRIERAGSVIELVFSTGAQDPVAMTRELEERLGASKEAWPLDAIRALWETLWECAKGRRKSPAHEARWFNMCGFLLRPGYGSDLDEWRLKRLWPVLEQGLFFARAVQNRAEWWNLWKRIAGGLNRMQQRRLTDELLPWLAPGAKGGKRAGKKRRSRLGAVPARQEIREMWQAVGACERIDSQLKRRLGDAIVEDLIRGRTSEQQLWALSRLGARSPLYGPLNTVVSAEAASAWVEKVVGQPDWAKPELTAFALVQISRFVGDRERDLDQGLRQRLAARIRSLPQGERGVRLLNEALPLEREEQARLLDESLPTGLRMR